MNVAPPPTLQYLLFEQPLPLVIALIAVAVVLRLLARRRPDRRLDRGALIAILAAIAVFVTAGAVTTDHERILQNTRQLVLATAPLDLQTVDQYIEPHATLSGPDGSTWMHYQQIRQRLPSVLQRFAVTGQRLRQTAAELHSPTWAVSVAEVSTYLDEATGLPVRTVWALTWQKDTDEQWRVNNVRWIEFQDQPPQQGIWN
jgi:hypothetical protein